MDIEDCIKTYQDLAKVVFGKKKKGGTFRKLFSASRGSSEWFSSATLKEVIRKIILEKCGNGRATSRQYPAGMQDVILNPSPHITPIVPST